MNGSHFHVAPFLGRHLKFLYPADPVFRIKYDNPGPFHVCKACQSSFPRIPGSCRQNYDLIFHMILLRSGGHQMRKNGKRHILECNRSPVKQFQKIGAAHLRKRSNLLCIELFVIGLFNTAFQFLFCKIREELLHYRIGCLLVRHIFQRIHGHIKNRQLLRHKQPAIGSKPLKNRL